MQQHDISLPFDALHSTLQQGDESSVIKLISELHPSEIASIMESLPYAMWQKLWKLIQREYQEDFLGKILAHVDHAIRIELLEDMQPQSVVNTTKFLEIDDRADILRDLPEQVVESVLRTMEKQDGQRMSKVLDYPEDTAAGLMNLDVISVRADVTLDVVMRYLRLRKNLPEDTNSIMVIDRDNHYLGILHLTDLLISHQSITVGELLVESPYLLADTPKSDVMQLFARRDLISAAVVDHQGYLLGRITIDDVVDLIQEDAQNTVNNMVGLSYEEDLFTPVSTSIRRRATWLGINLITVFLGSFVISQFEYTIQQMVTLAVLIPVVSGMGGIAGSQTLTIVIRGLSEKKLNKSNISALLLKESVIGTVGGIIWALVIGCIVLIWWSNIQLGGIISIAILINLIIATLAGAIIPFILKYFDIDPAIAGGVILTTIADIIGFASFLGLATLVLILPAK